MTKGYKYSLKEYNLPSKLLTKPSLKSESHAEMYMIKKQVVYLVKALFFGFLLFVPCSLAYSEGILCLCAQDSWRSWPVNLHPFGNVKCQDLWAQSTEIPVIKIKPVKLVHLSVRLQLLGLKCLFKDFKWPKLLIIKIKESKTMRNVGIRNTVPWQFILDEVMYIVRSLSF